ncbi:MAG: PAS domain-containing protein, partial [Ilumatobacter sp.]|nr:PAS domain-containing protein [Ilumatobacter sp.]
MQWDGKYTPPVQCPAKLADVESVQPARNAIIRPVRSERSAARRPIDAALRSPITARRSFVAIRTLVLLVAGIAFPLLTNLDATAVGVGLVVAAILQPIVVRTVRHDRVVRWQTLIDIHVAVLIVADEQAFLPVAALWLGSSLTWLSIATTRRASVAIGLLAVAEIAVLSAVQSSGQGLVVALALGMTLVLVTMIAQSLRQEMWAAESALVDALSAAGAVVHHSNLDDGTVTRIEGDLHGITGWTAEEWYSASHRDFIHPDDIDQYWVEVDDITPDTVVDRVARVRRPDGSWVWLRDIARISIDPDGRRSLRGFSLDVTELETATRTLETQARVDILTGLGNRWALT